MTDTALSSTPNPSFCFKEKEIVDFLDREGYDLRWTPELVIAKTTPIVTTHYLDLSTEVGSGLLAHFQSAARLDLKGVILARSTDGSGTLRLVAPGCTVPLEKEAEPELGKTIVSYGKCHDGVMYRFYQDNGFWRVSTCGQIHPYGCWGPKGTPSFLSLVEEAISQGQVKYERLVPGRCYYAVLETPNFTNLVKHDTLRLILMDIVDMNQTHLPHLPLESDEGFQMHDQRWPTLTTTAASDIGYTVYYSDGDCYRNESAWYKRAAQVRPNLPDPVWQWIELLREDQTTRGPMVQEFLSFFPWHQELFNLLEQKFDRLVDTVTNNYREIRGEGPKRVVIPSRHHAYMSSLLTQIRVRHDHDSLKQIIYRHLLQQDPKRICYLVNPYDA